MRFAQLVNERGLVNENGNVLAAPGSVPITGMALLDPVGRFVDGDLSIPSNVQGQVLVVQAANENRSDFRPLDYSDDSRVTVVQQAGNHVGIGGGYDQGGTAANVLEGVTGYFQNRGNKISDVPEEQCFNPDVAPTIYTEAYQTDANHEVIRNENGIPQYAWRVDDASQGRQTDDPHHPASMDESQAAANSAALLGALLSVSHWSQMNDVQRAAAFSALYNTVDHIDGGALPGDLGTTASALGLIGAIQSGKTGAMVVSGISLANAAGEGFASKEIASAMGMDEAAGNVVPGLGLALAIDSGNTTSIVAAAANFIPMWGPAISIGISVFGGSLFGDDDPPPPPEGAVAFSWDANGQMQHVVTRNQTGGGDTANKVAASVQALLQSVVDAHNAQNTDHANDLAINPYCLPKIGYSGSGAWMEVTLPDGSTVREPVGGEGFAQRLLEEMENSGGIAPAWQVQTVQGHVAQLRAEGVDEAQVLREAQTGRGGSAWAGNEAYSLIGNATESADFKTQSYGALVVHLGSSGVQAAQTQLSTALRDVDNDGYLEQTQSVAARDSAGKLQAVLTLDFNGDGVIQTRDVLNLGGNKGQDGNPTTEAQLATENADLQRNNVEWLDANGDGVLDKRDPAFAAIKLWVDLNEDGVQQSGEAVSLSSQHIASINFKTGMVTYDDGRIDALTAETLHADTEGVKLTQIQEVNANGTLTTLDAGLVLEHEGYQGKVQVTDEGGTRWVDVREQTYEQQAKRTGDWEGTAEQDAHRHGGGNVAGAPTETTATGATSAGEVKSQPNVTTQRTVTVDQVRVTYVPTAAVSSAAQEVRSVTAGMIRTLEDSSLFGLGALGALSLGGTQAAAMTAQANVVNDAAVIGDTALDANTNTVTTASAINPFVPASLSTTPNSTSITNHAEQEPTAVLPAVVHSTQSAEEAAAPSALPIFTVTATDNGTAWVASAQVATSQVASANAQAALAGLLALQHPDVQGETIDSCEDVVLHIPGSLLLSNDSTPNALADPNKPALTVTAVADATHGTVTLDAHGDVVFAPDANYHGSASFRYTVTDQYGLARDAIATLNITAVNDLPVTHGEAATTDEDVGLLFTQAQLLANDSDVDTVTDGQVLSISRVAAVTDANGQDMTHGTVTMNANGDIRYIPGANYHGAAQFTYWVSDGAGGETPATVSITVNSVNDLPVTQGETATTDEDVGLRFTQAQLLANDSDVDVATDGQVLSISRVATVTDANGHDLTHGTVTMDASGDIRYTPDANYNGSAQFTYWVSDGVGGETPATVSITVNPVNDLPVTQGETTSTDEDVGLRFTQVQLLANDSDVDTVTDGQVLSISRVAAVTDANGHDLTHGTVTMDTNGDIRYIPDANYNGPAQFTYWVSDGAGGETPATVSITVNPVNDLPVAHGEQVHSDEDVVLRFNPADLLANDTDVDVATNGQVLSISAIGNAQHGTVEWVTQNDGTRVIQFTPDANYHGPASFDYTVSDGNGGEATATVALTLAAVNDNPVAVGGQEIDSQEDQVLTIQAAGLLQSASDVDVATDGQVLSLSRVAPVTQNGENLTHGTVSLNANGDVVFTPEANYNGDATFMYWVKDNAGGESQGVTATIHLAAVDDAPTAQGEILTGASENAVFHVDAATLLQNDHDVDNADSELSLAWVGNAQHGTVALDEHGNVTFIPYAHYNGYASFSYTVKDLDGQTSPAVTASFDVAAVNDVPVAVDDRFITYSNSTMTIAFEQLTSNDFDVDGDALTVSGVRNAQHGTVQIVNGQVQFVPTSNYVGQASFDYLTDDGHGGQAWGTAYMTVKEAPNQYATVNWNGVYSWPDNGYYDYAENGSYQFYANRFIGGFSVSDDGYVSSITNITGNASIDSSSMTFTMYSMNTQSSTVWKVVDNLGLENVWHLDFHGLSQGSGGQWYFSLSSYMDYYGYYIPPIVLDLNNDGTHFTSLADSKVAFDLNGDGLADHMAWAGNDDGVLVWDKDHNGTVTDASEFGFQSLKAGAQTDLEGLQALDTNGDGKLDAGDDAFAEFAVWQDANGNGKVDAGEFKSLAALGIASIDLHSDGQVREAGAALAGNTEGQTDVTVMGNTHFTRTDGSTGQAVDAMLAYTPGTTAAAQATTQDSASVTRAGNADAHAVMPLATATSTPDAAASGASTVTQNHVTTSEPASAMTDAMRAEADLIRKVLLLNQMCNTAPDNDTPSLGFVPIAEDVSMHDLVAAAAQASPLQQAQHAA